MLPVYTYLFLVSPHVAVCPPMDPPSNGTFRAVPGVLSNGTVLTVDCQFGFLATGSRNLTCFNGEWFGEPECVCEFTGILFLASSRKSVVERSSPAD